MYDMNQFQKSLTSFTANGVVYASSTSALTTGSALTFDGSTVGVFGGTTVGYRFNANRGTDDTSQGLRLGFFGIDSYRTSATLSQAQTAINFTKTGSNGTRTPYYIDSDGNSIWSPGTGTSPSEQMRLTSTGLGIGTSSPLSKLTVAANNASAGNEQFFITGKANTQQLRIGYNTTSNYGAIQAVQIGTGYRDLVLNADGGNVGIGTSTPSSYQSGTAKLVAYANANSQNSIFVRNDSNGASSSSAIALNAAGNTWGIEIGSAAKNSNALTFQLDYGGTNSTKMTLDSSGNLGLGVTPSAWDVFKAVQIQQGSISSSANAANNTVVGSNVYYNAGWKYVAASARATLYQQETGAHSWHTTGTTTGTAGGAASLTQAMTLDASGNLGVGTTSPLARLDIASGDALFRPRIRNTTDTHGGSPAPTQPKPAEAKTNN